MTGMEPARSPLDRAFFALVTRGWGTHKIEGYEATLRERDKMMSGEASRTFVFVLLPLLYFWTSEKSA
jgi:hypothetical protein